MSLFESLHAEWAYIGQALRALQPWWRVLSGALVLVLLVFAGTA